MGVPGESSWSLERASFSMVSGFCPKAQPTPLPRRRQHQREGRQRLVAQTSPLGAPNGVGGGLWDQLRSGKTPAHLAAQYGHSNLVPVLLAAGSGAQAFSTHTLWRALRICSTFLTVSTMLSLCSHSSRTDVSRSSTMLDCVGAVLPVAPHLFSTSFDPDFNSFRSSKLYAPKVFAPSARGGVSWTSKCWCQAPGDRERFLGTPSRGNTSKMTTSGQFLHHMLSPPKK